MIIMRIRELFFWLELEASVSELISSSYYFVFV